MITETLNILLYSLPKSINLDDVIISLNDSDYQSLINECEIKSGLTLKSIDTYLGFKINRLTEGKSNIVITPLNEVDK